MKYKIIKVALAIIIILLLILVITNPSLKQFKEYIGEDSDDYYDLSFKRERNYIIYSVYEFSYSTNPNGSARWNTGKKNSLNKLTGKYTGVLLNFYYRPFPY